MDFLTYNRPETINIKIKESFFGNLLAESLDSSTFTASNQIKYLVHNNVYFRVGHNNCNFW